MLPYVRPLGMTAEETVGRGDRSGKTMMLRFHGVMVAAGIVAAMLSGGAALADARIFTVKASEPGVTEDIGGGGASTTGGGVGTGAGLLAQPATPNAMAAIITVEKVTRIICCSPLIQNPTYKLAS